MNISENVRKQIISDIELMVQNLIQDKDDEIARLHAEIDDRDIQIAQLKRTGSFAAGKANPIHAITSIKAIREGTRVRWTCTCGDGGTCDDDATLLSWHLLRGEQDAPAGPAVRVYAPDCGSPIFTGHEVPGAAPWQHWHRVSLGRDYLDLPPNWRIERL